MKLKFCNFFLILIHILMNEFETDLYIIDKEIEFTYSFNSINHSLLYLFLLKLSLNDYMGS